MLFLTYWFVLFAAIALALYWASRGAMLRKCLLLASCATFHWHFAGPAGVFPIILLGIAVFFSGRSQNRIACDISILLCVLALVFYKYTSFLCGEVLGMISPSWSKAASGAAHSVLPAAPPLGISFFVFEFVHYLYDVRKGTAPIRKPLDFALFAIFWPSIVAGPIKRYEQFVPSLENGVTKADRLDLATGLLRVGIGLLKKFVADNLTAYVNFFAPAFTTLGMPQRWWVFAAIGLWILFDFSGYSDMAIGYARMMGIVLPENFNWPYLARSINDFWRRWHISLSTWIRDYIYIPLGGSRVGRTRRWINGLIAFALCGLWHGAAWNFLAWGVYHGIGLAVQTQYRTLLGRSGRRLGVWLGRNQVIQWLLTLLFVHAGWLLFFYPLPRSWAMLKALFGFP